MIAMHKVLVATLPIVLAIAILIDSKKRTGRLSWMWAITMLLLCPACMITWIKLHPWLTSDLKAQYEFYALIMKNAILLFIPGSLFYTYRDKSKPTIENVSDCETSSDDSGVK